MELSRETVSALMERWSDEGIVTDTASEYGEPGYSTTSYRVSDPTTPLVVMGDYWCHCHKFAPDDPHPLHGIDQHHPRVWAQLEAQGICFEWYDEWTVDYDNDKAYRTEPDSYSWQSSIVWTDDGDILTPDDDIDAWLDYAVNDDRRCLRSRLFTDEQLAAEGFVERQCDYEAGWYGVEDNPCEIMAAIQAHENVDVLFVLSGVEQFRINFCVYVREREADEGSPREYSEDFDDD